MVLDRPIHVLVRVWLPDRPGALGNVAARIGSVRGDIVGVDILEREGGVAIDEFAVDLPSSEMLPPMLARTPLRDEGITGIASLAPRYRDSNVGSAWTETSLVFSLMRSSASTFAVKERPFPVPPNPTGLPYFWPWHSLCGAPSQTLFAVQMPAIRSWAFFLTPARSSGTSFSAMLLPSRIAAAAY